LITLLSLKGTHKSRPAAILGGALSLPEDVQNLPADSLLIAVNDHAFFIGVNPHMMVFFDPPECRPDFKHLVDTWRDGLRVTDMLWCTDVDVRGVERPEVRSGQFAAWLAIYLGCNPILLCGMDLYTSEQKYCHPMDEYLVSNIFEEPVENHIRDWRKLLKYPGHQRIRAMSGPLVEIFGKFSSLHSLVSSL
jgi:hypothetical protein